MLILSLFSGIDLLGKGFQQNGFTVVSAGDIILGHDIRDFKSMSGKFTGVIGGSPCQDFSKARRTAPTGYGAEMLAEYKRIVEESAPDWFLLENVPTVPDIQIDGYYIQRFDLCPSQLGEPVRRLRHFQFGSKGGYLLQFDRQKPTKALERTLTCSEGKQPDRRTYEQFCNLQGIPALHLPDLTQSARYKVVGNAVHLLVSDAIAKQIGTIPFLPTFHTHRVCPCGCGRLLTGKQKTATDNCRKKLSLRNRERAQQDITENATL